MFAASRRRPVPGVLGLHVLLDDASLGGRGANAQRVLAARGWMGLAEVRGRQPLMRRLYDLRHASVTRRLNEGVDEATVAAWAGTQ